MFTFPTCHFASSASGNGLLNDLIGHWQCDSTADDHTNNLTLTDNNTVQVGTGHVNANCGDFEVGNFEYYSRSSESLLQAGDITFSLGAWVQLESDITEVFVSKDNFGNGNREYHIQHNATESRFRFLVSDDGSAATLLAADNFGAPSTGVWYYVAAGHNAVSNDIWISVNGGTPDTLSHTTGVFSGSADFLISGIRNNAALSSSWDGLIENVNLWKTDIRGAKLAALYNGGSGLTFANYTS